MERPSAGGDQLDPTELTNAAGADVLIEVVRIAQPVRESAPACPCRLPTDVLDRPGRGREAPPLRFNRRRAAWRVAHA